MRRTILLFLLLLAVAGFYFQNTAVAAGTQPPDFIKALQTANINFILSTKAPTHLYIMGDADSGKACELVKKHNASIDKITNIETLVETACEK